MIEGFSIQTAKLSPKELELLPIFIDRLSRRIGKSNAVTSQQMIEGLQRIYKITITGARIRKIINHLRIKGILPRLMASSDGYYISNDKSELQKYIQSLKGREEAIKAVRLKLENEIN
jgi:hypothetical protein